MPQYFVTQTFKNKSDSKAVINCRYKLLRYGGPYGNTSNHFIFNVTISKFNSLNDKQKLDFSMYNSTGYLHARNVPNQLTTQP